MINSKSSLDYIKHKVVDNLEIIVVVVLGLTTVTLYGLSLYSMLQGIEAIRGQ